MSHGHRLFSLSVIVLTACMPFVVTKASSQNLERQFADRIVLPAVDRQSGSCVIVGKNVEVSSLRADFLYSELAIASSPSDVRKLVACSITMSSGVGDSPTPWGEQDIVFASDDGGSTWKPKVVGNSASDPTCAYGAGRISLFIDNRVSNDQTMWVYRSTDGGETWQQAATVPFLDTEMLTADRTAANMPGRMYLGGVSLPTEPKMYQYRGFYVMHSDDGGRTFKPPVATAAPKGYYANTGPGAVLTDGTLIYAVEAHKMRLPFKIHALNVPNEPGNANEMMLITRSVDGGRTLSRPIRVASVYSNEPEYVTDISALAADTTSKRFKDRIYVAWSDWRMGRSSILLSYSTDKGSTWSIPRQINDDVPFGSGRLGPDDFQPMLAVNNDGVVAAAWYDRRNHFDDLGWDVRLRASLDGGDTWLPSVRVSAGSNTFSSRANWNNNSTVSVFGPLGRNLDILVGFHSRHAFTGGDYSWMTADLSGAFHPIWISNQTGSPQIWTAPVQVSKGTGSNRSPRSTFALPADRQVPQNPCCFSLTTAGVRNGLDTNTAVRVGSLFYDNASKTFWFSVRLQNTSKHILTTPLIMQVDTLRSAHGTARVANADNAIVGSDAIWVFKSYRNRLYPHQLTQVRRIGLSLRELRPFLAQDFWTSAHDLSPGILAGMSVRIVPYRFSQKCNQKIEPPHITLGASRNVHGICNSRFCNCINI